MTQIDSGTAVDRKSRSGQGRMTMWGGLVNNRTYQRVTDLIFKSRRRQLILLASFPVLWVLVAHLGPVVQMFRVSFLDSYPPVAGYVPQFTLENWAIFFRERIFVMPYLRTLGFAFTFTFATLLLIYPVAYFLAIHVKRQNQLLLLLLLLIPFWVGEIVRTFAIMILLGNNGAVNLLLKFVGLIDRPIPFMYTSFSLGVGIVYLTSLYMLLPLYSALEKIPKSYREAGADLGAGAWTRFWRITLPLSREGITAGCILVFLASVGFYAAPVLLGGPRTTVFGETIAGFFRDAGDRWPIGAAFSTIMLITTLTFGGVFLKLMGRGGKGLLK